MAEEEGEEGRKEEGMVILRAPHYHRCWNAFDASSQGDHPGEEEAHEKAA